VQAQLRRAPVPSAILLLPDQPELGDAHTEHSVGGGATRAAEHGCPSERRHGYRDSRQHAPDPVRAKILVPIKDYTKENS
jgi:hypothetical protein